MMPTRPIAAPPAAGLTIAVAVCFALCLDLFAGPGRPPRAEEAVAPARGAPPTDAVARETVAPPGFVIELVAAEPAVVDPVAVTFDEEGRPYVVEYRDYPSGPPAGGPPLSRVVRLDDADGDGRYESSTVVADRLPFSQGVLAMRGGLLVTASPDVLLLTDSDGDGTLDARETIATGFRVGNPQLRAACPTLGPDNAVWITGGLSGGKVRSPSDGEEAGVSIDRRDVRIDVARGTIRPATGFGQFGNAFDSRGHRFTASNRNPLMVSLLPPEALERNPLVDLGAGFADAAPAGADSRVHAVAATNATAISHTGTHTSACGLTIFRGDLLGPEADGDAFTCEPVSHVVVRRRPAPQGAGLTSSHPEAEGTEFLASRETWFRPVFTATAPDGSLWVVDFCRASVEHPDYMPPGVAATVDHRAGDDAGRIWRVRRDGLAPRPWSAPESATEAVMLLGDPNGWRRDTAQRLLVEGRYPPDRVEYSLRALLEGTRAPVLARIHALRVLDGLSRLPIRDIERAAASDDAALAEEGLRLAREAEGINFAVGVDAAAARRDLCDRVAPRSVDHDDGQVRLAAILALAGSPSETATAALAVAAASQRLDAWTGRAILSGAAGRASPLLREIAAAPALPASPDRLMLVEKLAATAEGTAADVDALLPLLRERVRSGRCDWFDVAALLGLLQRRPLTRIAERDGELVEAVVGRAGDFASAPESAPTADLRFLGIRMLAAAAVEGSPAAEPARGALEALVTTREPEAIQREAVRGLVSCGDVATIDRVIAGVADLEPGVRAAAVGALLDRPALIPRLLAAVEGGAIPTAAVPLERRKPLLDAPDAAIRDQAARLFAAPAALEPDEFAALTQAVRQGGDQSRGREVFARHCANCHRAATPAGDTLGHAVGPDLAEAADRPIERLLLDVVEPNRSVESRYEATVVVTEEGTVVEGILAANTPDSIVLMRPAGERTGVPRDTIESLRGTGRSLMPEGFGRAIPPGEFADLLSFLRQGRVIGPPLPGPPQ